MKTLFKKGYVIRVTSWENDADNYKTIDVEAPTIEWVNALTDLFSLLKYSHSRDRFCNMYDANEAEQVRFFTAVKEIRKKHQVFLDEVKDEDGCEDYFMETLYEAGLSGGEYFTRVMDKMEVFEIPEEVQVKELEEFRFQR